MFSPKQLTPPPPQAEYNFDFKLKQDHSVLFHNYLFILNDYANINTNI